MGNGEALEEVNCMKLLGLVISNDLNWESNTDYLCKKAKKKIYLFLAVQCNHRVLALRSKIFGSLSADLFATFFWLLLLGF